MSKTIQQHAHLDSFPKKAIEPQTKISQDDTTKLKLTLEALTHGLTLPCDLQLQAGVSKDLDNHRVYSTATHQDALEVGTAFADELSRLGYEIEAVSYQEAKARRGNAVNYDGN